MDVSVIMNELVQRKFPFDEACRRYKEAGVDALDYSICEDYAVPPEIFSKSRSEWTKFFSDRAKIIKDNGLYVYQTHATYPTNYLTYNLSDANKKFLQDEELEVFKKQIEATSILGAKYIVIHPINHAVNDKEKKENWQLNLDAFTKIEPYLRKFDVKLGIEDMFGYDALRRRLCPTGISSAQEMADLIDELNSSLNSDRFVACLDTGHVFINALSPAEAIRTLGKRTELLHVQDNMTDGDHHLAPGIGRIDWVDFAKALKEVGYNKVISAEISTRVYNLSPDLVFDYVEYAVKALRRIIDIVEA